MLEGSLRRVRPSEEKPLGNSWSDRGEQKLKAGKAAKGQKADPTRTGGKQERASRIREDGGPKGGGGNSAEKG